MPRLVPVDWKTLECVFLRAGFEFENQVGSHRTYRKEGIARPVAISTYREIPVFIIQNNLRTGLSRQEYFSLLNECR